MNVISRGVRNAFRNTIRTVSIVIILGLSIGLALTMLIAKQAVESKIGAVKSSIGNTITISPAGARGFEGGGEPLTDAEIAKVRPLAHVTSVVETLQDRLDSTSTNLQSAIEAGSLGRRFRRSAQSPDGGSAGGQGNFTPPIFVVGTNTLDSPILTGGGQVNLSSGSKFDPTKDAAAALVGKTLATKNNLSAGSSFQAYGTTFTVSGIYDAGNAFSNNSLVMPLSTVQRLSQQSGNVSSAIAQVDSIANVDATVTAIQNTLGSDTADVVSQQDSSSQALAPLENIASISLYSLIGALVAAAMIILLTMLMIVRERRREIGVLKAIGASDFRVIIQFVTEAVTFTLIATVLGLVAGVAASGPITRLLVSANTSAGGGGFAGGRGIARIAGLGGQGLRNIQTSVGWEIILYGLAAALVIAVVGSALPAWLISKVRPAEVMRAE